MTSTYNPVGWFEIPVNDMERAMKFYTEVLGYELSRNQMGEYDMAWFPMIENAKGATGSLIKNEKCVPSMTGSIVYFSSPSENIANEIAKVEAAGGKVLQDKTDIGEHGFVAMCADTEGNQFALHSMK